MVEEMMVVTLAVTGASIMCEESIGSKVFMCLSVCLSLYFNDRNLKKSE